MSITTPRFRPGLVAVACLAGGLGCGPATLLERPRELPERLDGRVLWHTPNGYIYATDKSVAGETDRWIKALAGHVKRTYGSELGKGLVIVVDRDEKPIVDSFDALMRLERKGSPHLGKGKPPNAEDRRKNLEDSGMSEQLACRVTPLSLDDKALSSVGLSPDNLPSDAVWRMACPAQRVMEAAVWDFGPKVIEKRKGKAFAVMVAWAYPLAFPEVAKALRLTRDVLAFDLWCGRQEGSLERRRSETGRYLRERAFVLSPMLSVALSLAKSKSTAEGAADQVQTEAGAEQESDSE